MSLDNQKVECCLLCDDLENNNCPSSCESNILDQNCKEILSDYCTGSDLNSDDDSWLLRWPKNKTEGCWKYFNCNLFGTCVYNKESENNFCYNLPPREYYLDDLNCSKKFLIDLLDRYNEVGYEIASLPDQKSYNNFQNELFDNICCSYPVVCQDIVREFCNNKNFEQLKRNPFLNQWCGCHLNSETYNKYTNVGINRFCTPFCHNKRTLPVTDSKARPFTCQQNVCLIDDNTISLINSQSSDLNINFTQICGNCSSGEGASCQCYLNDNNIEIINSEISKSNINLKEICGSFTCQIDNPDKSGKGPDKIPIICGQSNNLNNIIKNQEIKYNAILFIIFLIGISLLLTLILLLNLKLRNNILFLLLIIITLSYFILSILYGLFYW